LEKFQRNSRKAQVHFRYYCTTTPPTFWRCRLGRNFLQRRKSWRFSNSSNSGRSGKRKGGFQLQQSWCKPLFRTYIMRNVTNNLSSNSNDDNKVDHYYKRMEFTKMNIIRIIDPDVSPADTSIQAQISSAPHKIWACQVNHSSKQENHINSAHSPEARKQPKSANSSDIVPMKETTMASRISELVNCTRDFITLKNWIFG